MAAILAALQSGPCSITELAHAAGYRDTAQARAYVALMVSRLRRRGYMIVNLKRRGDRSGAFYELRAAACERCGAVIASDHRFDTLCSPCQRSIIERGLRVTA
jgi:predicted Zn-ribbon and HTH transcriptional regulator